MASCHLRQINVLKKGTQLLFNACNSYYCIGQDQPTQDIRNRGVILVLYQPQVLLPVACLSESWWIFANEEGKEISILGLLSR